jgi:hypothetical protein
MKRIAVPVFALLLCACGATKIRPQSPATADWHDLRVMVQAQTAEDSDRLRKELQSTHLFGRLDPPGPSALLPDLVISAMDERVIGETTGPFCLNYALAYLTAGIVPEICDQRYQVDIDVTVPVSGRAARFRAELTQRRFIGLFGAITSMFGDWRFFGPLPGDPILARAALLDQKGQIDALMKKQ